MSSEIVNLSHYILENEPPLSPEIMERTIRFEGADGVIINGIVNAPVNKPVTQKALFLHEIEGEADGGTMRVLARRYAEMGIATLRIDFSGHGARKDEWERYSPSSMNLDAFHAINWLDQVYPDIDKTMLCGFSTGGAIAVITRAFDPRVSKSCLLYPVLSLQLNFLAALEDDPEFVADWDKVTPWRAAEFTKEKIEASLYHNAPFSLLAHTYGAEFIKDCHRMVEGGEDIMQLLHDGDTPVTIIQGTADFCVPSVLADKICQHLQQANAPIRHVRMLGMNHWVPVEWKDKIIAEFKQAAMTEESDFQPKQITHSLKAEGVEPSPGLRLQ